MLQNKYRIIQSIAGILLLGIAVICTSCTSDYEDYNTDKDSLTDEMLKWDMLGVGGFFPKMQMDIIPTSDVDANEFQRAQNLTGDIFSGYMAATGSWNTSNNNSTYNLYFDKWNNDGFKVAYRSVMTAWLQIKKRSVEYDLPSAFAVAQIIKIASLHRITDNHGPIPYFKFGEGGLETPYDSQEQVYMSFIKELTDAVDELDEFVAGTPTAKPLKKFDLIYGGDFVKWIKYANSLKLRLAMRIAYVEPQLAKKYAEEAVNHKYGVIVSNQDNAMVKSGNGILVSNPLKVVWDSYGDTRMGASMESFLIGYNDPRIDKYFRASTVGDGEFHGVRNGAIISNQTTYRRASVPNVEANTLEYPIQLMVAAEMYFLRAEGALRGWDMGGSAQSLYNEGINKSFEQHGFAPLVSAYINNTTYVPANYTDVFGSNNANAITDITIKWDESASSETKLERIITQKWLAMFPEGQEAWSEFRRTGYPKIFPVVNNNSNGTINTDIQIRRIPFPESEYSGNRKEVEKAILLLGAPDNGGTKVWWDKK